MGDPIVRFTDRSDGDFRVDGPAAVLDRRRVEVANGEWTWLRQVHAERVVTVTEPGEHAGEEADAAVTDHPDAVLVVHTADCVPVLLRSAAGTVVGAAHAGWRGLVSGVVEATVDAMVDLGAEAITADVGPHIRARCYEFGEAELDRVAARYGDVVRASTAWGSPALDITAGVVTALRRHPAVADVATRPGCTACEPERYFSHRARGDRGRHAAVVRPAVSPHANGDVPKSRSSVRNWNRMRGGI